jgi:integrase
MGCVRKRRGKWVADYRDNFGIRRWLTFETKREAEQALAVATQDTRQASRPLVDPDIQMSVYAERWLAQIAPTLKPRSVAGYAEKLRLHVLPAFGTLRVQKLDRGRIKALLMDKLASGLSPDSVRLIHATTRAMLNAALDDGIILSNPADKLGKVLRLGRSRVARQEQIKALDRDQLGRFLEATLDAVPRLHPLFLTLARTGLRLGEGLALQWSDVDFEARELRVSRALSTTGDLGTPKSGRSRTVDLSRGLCQVLSQLEMRQTNEWLARPADGSPADARPLWVFPSEAGSPLDHANVAKAFKRVLARAGLPARHSPHDLRHTFASLLLQQGESPVYVQRQLGHASIQLTVDTYGRWLPMGNKAAVDRLDEATRPQRESFPSRDDRF